MANKRDHKTGSILEQKAGLSARVMVGYKKNKAGRTIPHRVTVHAKGKAELNKAVLAVQEEYRNRANPPPKALTVRELCELWKTEKKRSGAENSTTENYGSIVDHHILPAFGDKAIKELDAATIQNTLYAKTVDGRVDGKGGLSGATVNLMHAILMMVFNFAVDQGYLEQNPMRLKRVKKIKGRKHQIRVMADDAVAKLLDGTEDARIKALFGFMLATGVRRGEALGLKWSEVDVAIHEVWIRQGLKKDKAKKAVLGRLKRDNTERTIPLHPDDFAALMDWKEVQDTEKQLLGKDYHNQGFVFANADGTRIYPDMVNAWLEKALARLDLPHYTPHEMRHTFASRMIRAGAHPKVLQELLGHSTIKMTMDTYGHLFPGMKREAVMKAPAVSKARARDAEAANELPATDASEPEEE